MRQASFPSLLLHCDSSLQNGGIVNTSMNGKKSLYYNWMDPVAWMQTCRGLAYTGRARQHFQNKIKIFECLSFDKSLVEILNFIGKSSTDILHLL